MEKLKNTRILALIGVIGLVLGTIMPYITISFFGISESISLWGYWEGKIIIGLAILNLMFIFKDFVEKYVPKLFNSNIGRKIASLDNPKYSLIPTILSVVFAIYLYNTLDLDLSSDYVKYGLGFWSLWIGIACLVGHAILYKAPTVNKSVQPQSMNYNQQPIQQPMQQTVQQPTAPQTNDTMQNGVKFCPSCGNKCDANSDKCFMCGRQF